MSQITKNSIGKKIQNLRERAGKSQEEVAGVLGIPRTSLSQIETGERDLTSLELAQLSTVFGVPTDYVLSDEKISQEIAVEPREKESEERISIPRLKKNKFKEVLLYILEKIAGKPNIGETVLYKLLYFCDFNYYEIFEEQLTGAKYIKNHYGPTPISFKGVVGEMIKNGEISLDKNKYHGYPQTRYIALRRPDLRRINGAEKEIIDDVLCKLSDLSAKQISEYSHDDTPWKIAESGKPIDYEAVFYRSPAYSVREYDEL
ncbi:repressor protein [Candidatus Berkelbacteria bacterium RIFOXYA2_FULL_43_10]|uniref:Repressor protein n=1 Tax=Candidatus Berkelbacteria bacterium RIFOXYA2_FULL_43_10 TaxID=1797472 RepID=A0A1F5E4N6_9BACT|nr:MAG: repressor protein [Candidatus Berkelbacteria bacterium RIFOXYA2_FULL_43_10]